MTPTKSTEEKQDEKNAKDEQKRAQVAAEAEKDNIEKAPAAATAAEAEAAATAELREQIRAEEREKLRLEATEASSDSTAFGGQAVTNEHFSIVTSDTLGREVLEIKPTGWVGPGFVVGANRVEHLKKALGELKNLPKQEK